MAEDNTQGELFHWKDKTVTQRSLMAKELEPLEYLIQDLIVTPGLVVLAGRKKIGKSWMALQAAQCVASGTPFLGKETKQGNVLYLALEDGVRRLKHRLEKQAANPALPIRYSCSWLPLNTANGFLSLTNALREKKYALIVIDTLAAALDSSIKENEAESLGKLFNVMHDMAIDTDTVILVIAHHGKKSYGDVGFDIRGSSAIAGATDANFGLYKNQDGTYSLKAEGRDIQEVDLRVQFDADNTWTWKCLGDDRDIRRVEAETRIIETIRNLGGSATVPDIAKELNIARPTIYTHLKRMRTEHKVDCEEVKMPKGTVLMVYKIPPKTGATTPTRLPGKPVTGSRRLGEEGSRQVGEVGDDTGSVANITPTAQNMFIDEDYSELRFELKKVSDGTDCLKLIASFLPEESV